MRTTVRRSSRRSRHKAREASPPSWMFALPLVLSATLVLVGLSAAGLMYGAAYDGRIFRGVRAEHLDLSGLTATEARDMLLANAEKLERQSLSLRDGQRTWHFTRRDLGLNQSVDSTVDHAMAIGRTGPPWIQLMTRYRALEDGVEVATPAYQVDSQRLRSVLDHLSRAIDQEPVDAHLDLKPGHLVTVSPSHAGRALNRDATERVIERALPDSNVSSVDLVVQVVAPKVSSGQLVPARTTLEQMVSRPLILRHGAQTWTLSSDDIAGFVAVDSAAGKGGGVLKVDEARLAPFVARVARDVNRPATNARFDFKGGQLQVIASERDGLRLDEVATVKAIEAQLPTNHHEITLPVVAVKPSFAASNAVKLGVRDLIATADTTYGDTIANRRFNVELAASRLNGSVVAPGQTFSLNDALGEVSYRSGYKQAYGITRTTEGIETIPSEGGGICQIATTLFHAVFWAGYPVVERNWHLYWIPRYGLPPKGLKGLDATIDQIYDKNYRLLYSVDFKFKNNTDHPLLIQAHTDGNQIRVSLFGAKPTWQVKVMGPTITNVVRADRAAVREPTSTLPAGQQLMVEEAEDGFTASIVRQILQDGEVKETQTFRSVYQPSRNVWLVGAPGGAATISTNASIPADQPANVPTITPKPKPAVAQQPRH